MCIQPIARHVLSLWGWYDSGRSRLLKSEIVFTGCGGWKPDRGTWIKPSLGWMLYRSGYGHKPNQNRVLRIYLSHRVITHILSTCRLTNTNRDQRSQSKLSQTERGGNGVIQWDPERDLFFREKDNKNYLPRKMLRQRAIQVCVPGKLSRFYASNILAIDDVTDLAHRIGEAHKIQNDKDSEAAVREIMADWPPERPYMPSLLSQTKLEELGMLPGVSAEVLNRTGKGKAC